MKQLRSLPNNPASEAGILEYLRQQREVLAEFVILYNGNIRTHTHSGTGGDSDIIPAGNSLINIYEDSTDRGDAHTLTFTTGLDVSLASSAATISVDKTELSLTQNDIANLTTSSNPTFANVTDSGLTATYVTYAGTAGLLSNSSTFTFDGTTVKVPQLTDSGLTITRVPYASTAGLLVDSANMTFNGTTLSTAGLTVTGSSSLNGAVVINESGADVDTRIEADTDANFVFLDGTSAGSIGFHTGTPQFQLDFVATTSDPTINIGSATATDNFAIRLKNGTNTWISTFLSGQTDSFLVGTVAGDGGLRIATGYSIHLGGTNVQSWFKINATSLTINEDGSDFDTRIEGDTDANLFVLDGGTDRVGIGVLAPNEKLEIASTTGRFITSDGGGATRRVLLMISPTAAVDYARIEAYNYPSTGKNLVFNTTGMGKVGICTTAPLRGLDINEASGNCLRLIYNDADGSAANYADFLVSSAGLLTITPSGGRTTLTDDAYITGAVDIQAGKIITCDVYTAAGINACIDALGSDGGTVILPVGTYTIDAPIVIDYANTTIQGSGKGTLLQASAWASWGGGADHVIKCIDINYCTIRDLAIDGLAANTGQTKDLIYMRQSHNSKVLRCFLSYSDNYGVFIEGSNYVDIDGNYAEYCDKAGVYMDGYNYTTSGYTGGYGCKIINNTTYSNLYWGGIYAIDSRNLLIANNTSYADTTGINCSQINWGLDIIGNAIYGSTGTQGMDLYNTAAMVNGNLFYACVKRGLNLQGSCAGVSITGNSFTSCGYDALYSGSYSGSNNIVIAGNSFTTTANTYNDIKIANDGAVGTHSNYLITGNIFKSSAGNSERAVYVATSTASAIVISNNESYGHDTCGIELVSGVTTSKIISNALTDATQYIDSATGTVIENYNGTQFSFNQPLAITPFTTAGILHNAVTTGIISSSLIVNADITANTITYASLQQISADLRVLGNISGAAGNVAELTGANVRTICGLAPTDGPTFDHLHITNAIDAGAITGTSFVIGANTLTTTEWAYLDGIDQALKKADSAIFAGLTVSSTNGDIIMTKAADAGSTRIFMKSGATGIWDLGTAGDNTFQFYDRVNAKYPFSIYANTPTNALLMSATEINISHQLTQKGGAVVFNEDSGDYDFRIEGDTDANLFFCDAGNDRVAFGSSAPEKKVHVVGAQTATTNYLLKLSHGNGGGGGDSAVGILFCCNGLIDANRGKGALVYHDGSVTGWDRGDFVFLQNSAASTDNCTLSDEVLRIKNSGVIIVNENGNDADFRIEGDTDANLFFVDAGADKVGIKTNAPGAVLDINSDTFILRTAKTPATAGAAGTTGMICWDNGFIYVCVNTNTWLKAAIATW